MTEHMIERVRQLSAWLDGTGITLLELSGPGQQIRLQRSGCGRTGHPTAQQLASPAMPESSRTLVLAGSVGRVLYTHPLRETPLVQPGQQIVAGQTVALLKIGAVLLEVAAPRAGVVSRIVAVSETLVGFGTPLIELE